jgi:hypothetical protein
MTSAVSRESLAAEVRFHSHSGARGVCGWQSGTATGFYATTSVFALCYIIPPSRTSFHLSLTLYNLRS